jgi:hypothetical protein
MLDPSEAKSLTSNHIDGDGSVYTYKLREDRFATFLLLL